MPVSNFQVDKRIVDRNILEGSLSREEYDRYLQSLPDASANMDVVNLQSDSGADEEDEDDASDTPWGSAP